MGNVFNDAVLCELDIYFLFFFFTEVNAAAVVLYSNAISDAAFHRMSEKVEETVTVSEIS